MPIYRSISISLISQFDIKTIPEFPVVESATDAGNETDSQTRRLDEEELLGPRVTVYAPIYTGSQFWIRYSVARPVPRDSFFFFKLFINGKPVTSWGVGEEEQWKGKAVFTLENLSASMIYGRWRRRNFFFGKEDADGLIELRVFRANGRKSIPPPETLRPNPGIWQSHHNEQTHSKRNSKTINRDSGIMCVFSS
jgi:hypothetical protein